MSITLLDLISHTAANDGLTVIIMLLSPAGLGLSLAIIVDQIEHASLQKVFEKPILLSLTCPNPSLANPTLGGYLVVGICLTNRVH